jgi:cap-snatching RNA endonuclease
MSFYTNEQTRLNTLLHSLVDPILSTARPDIELDNLEILKVKAKTLGNLLHNSLHVFFCYLLNITPHLDTSFRFCDYFGLDPDYQKKTHLTPDIVFVTDDFIYIIDVTVTVAPELARQSKIEKYSVLVEFCKEYLNKESCVFAVALNKNLQNLETELFQFSKFIKYETPPLENIFINHFNTILNLLDEIYPVLPDDFLKDNLNLGSNYKSDFLSPDVYRENQKRFKFADDLQKHEYLSLTDVEDCFMELVTDDDIIKNLMEKPTDKNLICEAFEYLDNNDKFYKDPKPSAHIAYCEYDDSIIPQFFTQHKVEQNQVLNLLKFVVESSVEKSLFSEYSLLKTIYLTTVKLRSDL